MPQKGPHISLAPERLVKRVLGVPLEEFQTWPEYLQELALTLAEELFIIRYNPFITPESVRASVQTRLQAERSALSPEYFQELSGCLDRYWNTFEQDKRFKAKLVKRMQAILPKEQVVSAPKALIECSTDATDLRMEIPALVVYPETTEQIQAIVRLANEMGFPLIARGGGTGATGGAVPAKTRTVVLSLSRMKEILSVDPENRTICAQAGVITLDAINAAAARNLLLTVDPASKAGSSIGGNVSENAGGPFAFEYGTTLDNVFSYKMVLPSGDLIEVRRQDHPRHKILSTETAVFEVLDHNGTLKETIRLPGDEIRGKGLGKDVSNKYLGGLPGIQKEGVDGIITEACFTVFPQLAHARVLCLEFFGSSMRNAMYVIRDVAALRDDIRRQGDLVKISAMEEFGVKYVQAIEYSKKSTKYEGQPISVIIVQLDSDDAEALNDAVSKVVDITAVYDNVDSFVARDGKEAEEFWHDRHQLSAISKRTSGFKINEDVVIPLEVVPEFSDFLESLNLHYLAVAYRKALHEVQRLPEVDVADEFIKMELEVTSAILKGNTTQEVLAEQDFQVQTSFFFQDLKSRYPAVQDRLAKIFDNLLQTRIIVACHMHAGDGNCHVNIPVNSNDPEMLHLGEEAAEKVFARVLELKGGVSGEHGIGITKISFLQEDKIRALKGYKKKVDPNNIFNPGKLTQRDLVVVPYTFSFNRLIKDITKTALPGKERLIDLLLNIQACTRCGKCKQVCPMYLPQRGLLFHPRNKNITLGALIEAIYYSQLQTGDPDPRLLRELRNIMDHCTACGKCMAICPVKIKTQDVTLHIRAYLEEKGAGGHPLKTRVLNLLGKDPQASLPVAAKAASLGQEVQNRVVGFIPGKWRERIKSPLFNGRGPVTEFTNLAASLKLDKGGTFTPKNGIGETVLYFPGCGAGLFYRDIGLASIYLLLRSGVSVLVPPKHLCCGYPLLASGCTEAFERIGRENRKQLNDRIAKANLRGMSIQAILTSCGTCREGIEGYQLKSHQTEKLIHQDVVQFLLTRLPSFDAGNTPNRLVYHAACHAEWTGVPKLKAADMYSDALADLLGTETRISPRCCGESGLGALTSPDIYNRLRARKREQLTEDLQGYPQQDPILVGCPSCRIGITRTMMEMGVEKEVLHTLEYLARLAGGPKWKKDFLKALGKARQDGGARIVAL
ncbi:MAG TPA: FAD-binding and (Fe-S)-binding domain-containing protein [Desulfomicrobiaceae bacterium]|nr:FAD-binding and (Fe-S)-binding domain-containing protein [Desulfomicrobiaceae bacterium]